MKYTRSRDSIMRANLIATKRVTADEYQWLRKRAKVRRQSVKAFLSGCLDEGLANEEERAREDAAVEAGE